MKLPAELNQKTQADMFDAKIEQCEQHNHSLLLML
jgi:hypothetical protein